MDISVKEEVVDIPQDVLDLTIDYDIVKEESEIQEVNVQVQKKDETTNIESNPATKVDHKCKFSGKVLTRALYLKSPMNTPQSESFECKLRHQKFTDRSFLTNHMSFHNSARLMQPEPSKYQSIKQETDDEESPMTVEDENEDPDIGKDLTNLDEPRKRSRQSATRQKNVRKYRKYQTNGGMSYFTRHNKLIPPRTMKPGCGETCRRMCSKRISVEDRQTNFEAYYRCESTTEKWIFIRNLCEKSEVATSKANTYRKRGYGLLKYKLRAFSRDDQPLVYVCSVMFVETLSIAYQVVYTAMKKIDSSLLTVAEDQRGKYKRIKLDEKMARTESVINHLKSLPAIGPHKRMKTSYLTTSKYSFNITQMFNMYKEYLKDNHIDVIPATYQQYRAIMIENKELLRYSVVFITYSKKDQLCRVKTKLGMS